jgi:hypothetical protein
MLVCTVTASHAEKSSFEGANFAAIHFFVPSVHGLRILHLFVPCCLLSKFQRHIKSPGKALLKALFLCVSRKQSLHRTFGQLAGSLELQELNPAHRWSTRASASVIDPSSVSTTWFILNTILIMLANNSGFEIASTYALANAAKMSSTVMP